MVEEKCRENTEIQRTSAGTKQIFCNRNDDDSLNDDGGGSLNSSDEALLDMLGIGSLGIPDEEDVDEDLPFSKDAALPDLPDEQRWKNDLNLDYLVETYRKESLIVFPPECSIPAEHMRRLTEELVWGGDLVQADRTYETIHIQKNGSEVYSKKVLTRLEHFVDAHQGWSELCHDYLQKLVSKALGIEMVLYKEKLNIKPAGGSGFAPHLDTPSLRIALGADGPKNFCTVMVAIDDMTEANGCLRVCRGAWSEEQHVDTILPEEGGNPDAGGRAGAIPVELADEELNFEPLVCKGGTIAVFNGWAPHRSAANLSLFPRRAVFLTYNPKDEGNFHKKYYEKMEEKRQRWRESVGLAERKQREEDERLEMDALATIPTL